MAITYYPLSGPTRIVALSDHGLIGLGAIGILTPVAGERVTLSGQTDPDANGIYIAAVSTWGRAPALAGDVVTMLSAGVPAATEWVWQLTSKPAASTLQPGPLLDATGDMLAEFIPDVAGEYGFTVVGRWVPQGIAGLPANTQSLISGVETSTVHVAALATMPIRTKYGQGATLELTVLDELIKAAALVGPVDEASGIAAQETVTVAALAALVGIAPSAIGSDLATVVADLKENQALHRVKTAGSVHALADTVSVAQRYAPKSLPYAIDAVNEQNDLYVSHAQTGSSGGRWHAASDDTKNIPVAAKATDHASATVLAADLRERCFERHRVQIASPDPHGAADNASALTAPSLLDAVIVAYLDALVLVGAAAAGAPEGAFDLAATFGFKISA